MRAVLDNRPAGDCDALIRTKVSDLDSAAAAVVREATDEGPDHVVSSDPEGAEFCAA